MSNHLPALRALNACDEAVQWSYGYPDADTAWAACHRGDWMLWLLGQVSTSGPWSEERKPLVAACIDCARLALPHSGANREEMAALLATLERWATSDGDLDEAKSARVELRKIWHAAAYAADAAAASAASAAYAADAAYAAASAAYADGYASDAVSAACAAARTSVLAQCADIVRRHFPAPPSLTTELKP